MVGMQVTHRVCESAARTGDGPHQGATKHKVLQQAIAPARAWQTRGGPEPVITTHRSPSAADPYPGQARMLCC